MKRGPEDRVSPSILRQILRYDPETGKLFWLFRDRSFFNSERHWKQWNTAHANKEAFTAGGGSMLHRHGKIFNVLYYAHLVAWAIHHGEWPTDNIDHIDGVECGNKISNLRLASQQVNMQNKRQYASNSSGVSGVSWHKKHKKWQAYITINKKRIHLGFFSDLEEAKNVRLAAQNNAGFHENHGRLN